MGYSYAAKAGYTLDALQSMFATESSNGTPDGGFYEYGKERADGAIVGTVWQPFPQDTTRVIRPDGTIKAFPGIKARTLRAAEAKGAQTYARIYGSL